MTSQGGIVVVNLPEKLVAVVERYSAEIMFTLMITILSAPETLNAPALAQRFMVQLVSNELVLDAQGVPVPTDFKTLDVVVVEPNLGAIATLLCTVGHLKGYQIVSYWIPQDCDCF